MQESMVAARPRSDTRSQAGALGRGREESVWNGEGALALGALEKGALVDEARKLAIGEVCRLEVGRYVSRCSRRDKRVKLTSAFTTRSQTLARDLGRNGTVESEIGRAHV